MSPARPPERAFRRRILRLCVAAAFFNAAGADFKVRAASTNAAGAVTNVTGGAAKAQKWDTGRICDTIERVAKKHGLPLATFTRLIWIESRFDIKALSPKGAQGIAQFMPGTARERGLSDPWNPALALPASASLLSDLKAEFGNFGLAAAAYNAGAGRVERWLGGRSSLPFETQDYVAAITGKAAAAFRKRDAQVTDFSLKKGEAFAKSCRDLPVLKTRFRGAIAGQPPRKPWGVQVAGHFSQAKAMASWTRVRAKLGPVIGNTQPRLYRQRTPRGMKSKWTVRLGTDTRIAAIQLCQRIRAVGGFCLVRKNS